MLKILYELFVVSRIFIWRSLNLLPSWIFLVAKLLYNYLCPSVRMSVRKSDLGGNVIFSAPN